MLILIITVSSVPHCFVGCNFNGSLLALTMICLLLNSIGGMVVAAIIKVLDNIVKIYTSAIANILTAVLCTVFFPENFQLNIFFLASLLALLVGIYLYEVKTIPKKVTCMKSWILFLTLIQIYFIWNLSAFTFVSL